jgi:acetate kinase
MKILALNCGSSSLKFQITEILGAGKHIDSETELLRGRLKIEVRGSLSARTADGQTLSREISASNQTEAVRHLVGWLNEDERRLGSLDAIGHRVVHGGEEFAEPTRIDERVIGALAQIGPLAPLHNGTALEVIRETRRLFHSLPMVATFDTTFHRTMPEHARRYAISEEFVSKHRLWRHGFHGLAHRWMMERYAQLSRRPRESSKLVTMQLGSGCSMTAIENGRSIETSMGLTPLEGLMMATRSGDIDPSLPGLLARLEGVGVQQVEGWLNTRSGLFGVHGSSGDVAALLKAERQGDSRAALALEMFCHRVRKYLGAYFAVLGGAEAIVFGGGVGENEPAIRERVCRNMDWCGLRLDLERNKASAGQEACISADDSDISIYVVPVNEEALIARDTFECLGLS